MQEKCGFRAHCLQNIQRYPSLGACMNPKYFLYKAKGQCDVYDKIKKAYELDGSNRRKDTERAKVESRKAEEEVSLQKRASSAAPVYLAIFEGFDRDPLTDDQIADRLFAQTGVRPTHRNISSYRCMYNQGKLQGQTGEPAKKVERLKGRKGRRR